MLPCTSSSVQPSSSSLLCRFLDSILGTELGLTLYSILHAKSRESADTSQWKRESSRKRGPSNPESSFHTSDRDRPKSKSRVQPLSCHGLCLMKGNKNAMVSGSNMFTGQAECLGGKDTTRSAALYNCFHQNGCISLGTMKICIDF